MPPSRAILFTAFEPSGDALSAPTIARLLADDPTLTIYALGGPKMAAAGAHVIEHTTEHAKMLLGAASEAGAHLKRLRRLKRWLREHPIDAVVPVDSPAANWSICGLVKKVCTAALVVHLVCPQVWAWATWRIHKLKRLTDHVMCILPFEVAYLRGHDIACTFVGHPVFERQDPQPPEGLPAQPGAVKLALLPGSRTKEVASNYPTMLGALGLLRERGLTIHAAVGASDEIRAAQISAMTPPGVEVTVLHGQTDAVIHWADVVLATSGTVTLQVLACSTPMVAMYNMSEFLSRHVFPLVVKTRTFTLPNLIGESMGLGRVIREFVPHFGDPAPIAEELASLMGDGAAVEAQRAAFAKVHGLFAATDFATSSAQTLRSLLEAGRGEKGGK